MLTIQHVMAAPDIFLKDALQNDDSDFSGMKAIVRVDKMGEIHHVSRSMQLIFGDCNDFHGLLIQDYVIHTDDQQRARFQKVLDNTFEFGQKCSFVQEVKDKNGANISLKLCTAPLLSIDMRVQYLLIIFEYNFITEKKQLQLSRSLDIQAAQRHRLGGNFPDFPQATSSPVEANSDEYVDSDDDIAPLASESQSPQSGRASPILPIDPLPTRTYSAASHFAPPRQFSRLRRNSDPHPLMRPQIKAGRLLFDAIAYSGAKPANLRTARTEDGRPTYPSARHAITDPESAHDAPSHRPTTTLRPHPPPAAATNPRYPPPPPADTAGPDPPDLPRAPARRGTSMSPGRRLSESHIDPRAPPAAPPRPSTPTAAARARRAAPSAGPCRRRAGPEAPPTRISHCRPAAGADGAAGRPAPLVLPDVRAWPGRATRT
jgi:hypothetical protein